MKQFIKSVKKSGVFFLSSLLLICFFSAPFFAHVTNETNGAEQKVSEPEGELSGNGGEDPEETDPSYLFIGNSKTYYNNLPEMFKRIVFAGTGEQIQCTSLTYSGRSEEDHGGAVKAVGRTKGISESLNNNEKVFFTLSSEEDAAKYNEAVYQKYAESLLDEEGNPKHFDYIVIQLYSPELSYEKRKAGVLDILRTMCDQDTSVVLSIPTRKYTTAITPFTTAVVQDDLDEVAKTLCWEVRRSVACKSAVVALTGRASINYLLYEGDAYAQNESPDDYNIYLKTDGDKVKNDLVIGDRNHPTQLGTYLYACVLYSAIYGKNPLDTVESYHAETENSICNMSSLKNAVKENYALKNGAFRSEDVLRITADLAYWTQCGYFHLPLEVPVIKSVKNVSDGVTVKWDKSKGAESYSLLRKEEGGNWNVIANTTGTAWKDTTVKTGVLYAYAVSCVAEGGSALASNYLKNYLSIRFLRIPTMKSIQAVNGGVKVKWKSTGAAQYVIYRKTGTGSWKKVGTSSTTQFVDKKVTAGTAYDYTVRSYESSVSKSSYDPQGIHTLYLGTPRVLSVSPLKTAVRAKWSKATHKVTGYEIQYSTSKKFSSKDTIVTVKGRKNITKKIKKLRRKTSYYVRVRSYRTVKGVTYRSAWSTAVMVKTK